MLIYMSKVTTKNLNSEISTIKQDVALLRSLIIGLLGKDTEGNYRPSFVKRILKAAKEKSTRSFSSTENFLSQIS